MARLGDICEIAAGQGAPQGENSYCNCNEGIPFIKAGDLSDLLSGKLETEIQCVNEIVAKQHKLKLYPAGSILFAKSGMSCMKGYVYRTKNPCYIVSHLAIVIPQGIDGEYLKYYFQHNKPNALIKDSAYPSISLQDISNIELTVPSLDIQASIASELNKVNMLISLRKQQLSKLDELVKARFAEMFGDAEHNTMNWPTAKLSSLCDVGSSKRIYQSELTENGVPFLRISDLNERIDGENNEPQLFIPKAKFDELKSNGLVPSVGDILVTARGTLGRCYIVKVEDSFYFQDGMISWLSDINESLTSLYISELFATTGIHKQIANLQAGSTVAYLSIAMLKKLDIMIPPKALQQQFAAFVEQTDKSKFEIQKSLEKLETLKKALMQKYFG